MLNPLKNNNVNGRMRRCASTLGRLWLYVCTALLVNADMPLAFCQSPNQTGAAPAEGAGSPLDEPLRLIAQAHEAMKGVRDYSCTLIKRERIKGQLQPNNVIIMKVRNNPFSVYMGWKAPEELVNQEICYIAHRHKNTMRAKSPGIIGVAGFITVDLDDPRAKENSNHSVAEAGIGKLIERMANDWGRDRQLGQTSSQIAEYEYNKRRCLRVETTHPARPMAPYFSYRTVIYFDKENHFPIRLELYDWPRAGGAPTGDLIEVYSYVDLRLNVGVRDEVFNQ
jgi:hypothetical protein